MTRMDIPRPTSWSARARLWSVLLLSTTVLAACWEEDGQEAAAAAPPQAMPVQTVAPVAREIQEWDEFVGRFEASQRVEIQAQVSGYLEEILFTDGQLVTEGDVLFRIDQRPFQTALKDAEARHELAKQRFARAQSLTDSQVISADTFQQRSQELRSALAGVERAQLDLEHTEIRAPISGRIGRKLLDVGSLISGGANSPILTTIVNVQPIHLYADATEDLVLKRVRERGHGRRDDQVALPAAVEVKLVDEDQYSREGVVDFVDNEYSAETGTILFRAAFENTDGFLESGMFARMRIAAPNPLNVLLVPDQIIGTEQSRKFVYVISAKGTATRKYLELGQLLDDGLRVVKGGLEPDDVVITANLNLIRPGAPVTPANPEE